jgi:hypothetical protein
MTSQEKTGNLSSLQIAVPVGRVELTGVFQMFVNSGVPERCAQIIMSRIQYKWF